MKKNILAVAAVVFAITLSSFTVKETFNFYAIYDEAVGPETDIDSYSFDDVKPAIDNSTTGTLLLNWFRIQKEEDTEVTSLEFSNAFDLLDSATGTVGSLVDETENSNYLDLKRVVQ